MLACFAMTSCDTGQVVALKSNRQMYLSSIPICVQDIELLFYRTKTVGQQKRAGHS